MSRAKPGPLLLRVISAGIMAPVALAAAWFGRPWLPILAVLAVGIMGWEWARLCARGGFGPAGLLIVGTGMASVAALAFGLGGASALGIAVVGSACTYPAAALTRSAAPWAAAGTLWIAAGTIAFLWLAVPPVGDHWTALWLLAVVWATDIVAYAAGRSIGGPKLAPRWSPNKTWAGFIGGVSSAGLIGLIAAVLAGSPPLTLIAVSLALAVAAQAGDLAESLAKRHFGVKDASSLIPGHGGLLDRLDGLLVAAMAAGVLTALVGDNPLAWR